MHMSSSGYDWNAEIRENCEKIISHLNNFGTITAREARDNLHINDFQYYINLLKRQGYKFDSTEIRRKNQQGETVVGFVYRLTATPNT